MADIRHILGIRVPMVVRLAEKNAPVREVLELAPGSVINFDRPYDALLELMANDRVIALGKPVKVNERFGLQVEQVASAKEKLNALA